MCRIVLINSMTLSTKYSTPIIVSIIVSVVAIGISFQGSTAESFEFDPLDASINGLQIETTFYFVGMGNLSYDTFSVYEQLSGFKKEDAGSFRLLGLTSIDKIGLYELADRSFNQRYGSENDPIKNFGIDVRIVHNEQVIHEFKYKRCEITDYKVTTLFDADETFSGKTKFAIVDGFEFECKGYYLNTPLFEKLEKKIQKANTTSTIDLERGVTWKTDDSFQSKGFEP